MIQISERQVEAIEYYFRKTTEPYDDYEWDGKELTVWLNDELIERYNYQDLCEMIPDFESL